MRLVDRAVVIGGLVLLVVLGSSFVVLSAPPAGPIATVAPALPLPSERVVREGLIGEVRTLDPLYASTQAERDIDALIFSGLVRLGPGGRLIPDLARRWDVSSGGRVYTFRLREEARWHDGEPVTADDVVFTILSLQHPDYDGPAAGPWRGISVERVGRYGVRFRLPTPAASFLVLASQPIVPGHLLSDVPVADRRMASFGRAPVGTGPFQLDSFGPDEVSLVPVGSGRPVAAGPQAAPTPAESAPPLAPSSGERPPIERYRFVLYASADAAAAGLRSGEIDALGGLDTTRAQRLANVPGIRAIRYPRATLTAITLNLRFEVGIFRDARVRRALLAAIDRPGMLRELLGGWGTVAETPISPASFAYHRDAAGQVPYDPKAARKLFREAGWKTGPNAVRRPGAEKPTLIELLTINRRANPLAYAVAEQVAADWRAIGLRVRLISVSRERLVENRLVPRDFQAVVLDVNLGLDPDLYPLLASSQAVTGGTNISGYQSAALDRRLVDARRYAPPGVRRQRFVALQKELARELPILPLFFADYVFLVRDTLDGPGPHQIATPSDRFWDVLAWRLADDGPGS